MTLVAWAALVGEPRAANAAGATSGPLEDGPGGPILVVEGASNPFSLYYAEILRAEGLDEFDATDLSLLSTPLLTAHHVVILGELSLSAGQVSLLTAWVNAGGTLIAMRPDRQLAGLLGLTDAGGTIANPYLRVQTASGPGKGITDQAMQVHGAADRYTLNGATAVATLYSDTTTATSYPAVTTRDIGSSGGRAIAFTYDLARSVVYTRQGNPAWAGQLRDGHSLPRSDDLFFGAWSSDPQPDWVTLSRRSIPQADEQQRLLANLILQGAAHRMPLPRFWYFPRGKKAVVILTGDDHQRGVGTQPRFEQYLALSDPGCSLDDWECVRATSYVFVGSHFTSAQAAHYDSLGFEVGLHVNHDHVTWNPATLDAAIFTPELQAFAAAYPGLPAPVTSRMHAVIWSDYATQPEVEVAHGIRLDTNYYFYPPEWVADRPGLFTGSGMPMRFARPDGTMIDCYQVTTQMTDESGQTYPRTIDSLLARALDARGFYGAFCANMHTDTYPHPGSDAIVASAKARGVPIVTSRQMLTWLDGRNGSSFGSLAWSSGVLSFTVTAAPGARNLEAMLPTTSTAGGLVTLSRDGLPVPWQTETIKGIEYAFFPAPSGSYRAHYGGPADVVPRTPVRAGVALLRLTPNPSRGRVQVEFDLARESDVRLAIVDLQGRGIAGLPPSHCAAGRHRATWNVRLRAGVYFVRIEASGIGDSKRLVIRR